MSTSKADVDEERKYFERRQIFTNEYVNLLFEKSQQRFYTEDE